MKLLFLMLILSLSFFDAHALVNLRNASYNEKWIDFVDPRPGLDLRVERFYSSRSLFLGVFGFGWCSSLETHLSITSDGIINLVECGGGLEVTYYPDDFDLRSSADTIEAIVKDYKKNKKMSRSDLANLRTQLKSNTKMRFEYANKLGLIDIKKIKANKNTFLSKSKGFEKITYDGQSYLRKRHNGVIEKFDHKGKLVQRTFPSGQFIKINYKGPHISFLVDSTGRRISFAYNSNGTLKQISNGQGLTTSYVFSGENLVKVTNMWSKTYTYDYDANHNMTHVAFPDGTSMKMSYDLANDWIKTYTNRQNCKEEYQFATSPTNPKNKYSAVFSRQCPKGKRYSGRHVFSYRNYTFSNDKYLDTVYEDFGEAGKELLYRKKVQFHPYLGRPLSITENNFYRAFYYYNNGLVNKREHKEYEMPSRTIAKWDKTAFKYNFEKLRVTETNQQHLDKTGKTTKTDTRKFQYNGRGQMTKAQSPKGQYVAINYEENNRMNRLNNQVNESILLTYKPGVDKPSFIEQKNLGKVEVSYDDNGEVESIESIGKRNIASSVVEKFLEMISFLGPMGEELKL